MRIRLPKRHPPDSHPERLHYPLFLSAVLYALVGFAVGRSLGFSIDPTFAWFDFQLYLAGSYVLFMFSRSFRIQAVIQLALTLVFAWVNLEKLFRAGDYLRAGDPLMLDEFLKLVGAEGLGFTVAALAIAAALLLGLFAWNAKWPERVDYLALVPVLSVACVFHALPARTFKTNLKATHVEFANVMRAAGKDIQARGLFLNFLVESVEDTRVVKKIPREEIDEALRGLEALMGPAPAVGAQPDAKPNVYVISHESFWNPSLLAETIPQEESLSPEFLELWRKNGSRYVLSPSFGGYTANWEFELLCGLPAMVLNKNVHFQELAAKSPSCLPRVLSEAGYSTVAYHPGDAGYYNRQIVYRALGFDEDRFEHQFDQEKRLGGTGSFDGFVSDQELFKESLARIDRLLADRKPFLFYAMSISGHTPFYYPRGSLEPKAKRVPKVEKLPEDKVRDAIDLNWYESLWLAEFVQEIWKRDPTAIVVAAGDHQPGYSRRILAPDGNPVRVSLEKFYAVPLIAFRGRQSPAFPVERPVAAWELASWILRGAGVVDANAARFQWLRTPPSLAIRPVGNGTLVSRAGAPYELCSSGLESSDCRTTIEWTDRVRVLAQDLWLGETTFPALLAPSSRSPAGR